MADDPTASRSPSRGARGPYAKSAVTKQRILETALEVFSTVGYNASSLRTIADQVGMTVPGLLHHFEGKEQMLQAVLDERDRADLEFLETFVATPPEIPGEGFLRLVRRNEQEPGIIRLFTMLAAEAIDPSHPAHAYFVRRNEHARANVRTVITALAESGRIPTGVDVERLAQMALALMYGLQLQFLLDPSCPMVPVAEYFIELIARATN